MAFHVSTHPLAQQLLSQLRNKSTGPQEFRRSARVLSTLLAIESTVGLPLKSVKIDTPLEETTVEKLAVGLACVPVLRAGLSMLEPFLELYEDVAVGYIGLERDHVTAVARQYYENMPDMNGRIAVCLDPMLATGGSASNAITLIKNHKPDRVIMVAVVAAPEGVSRLRADHPDVEIYAAALDRELNEKMYILPGLGDYGDRLYGTI